MKDKGSEKLIDTDSHLPRVLSLEKKDILRKITQKLSPNESIQTSSCSFSYETLHLRHCLTDNHVKIQTHSKTSDQELFIQELQGFGLDIDSKTDNRKNIESRETESCEDKSSNGLSSFIMCKSDSRSTMESQGVELKTFSLTFSGDTDDTQQFVLNEETPSGVLNFSRVSRNIEDKNSRIKRDCKTEDPDESNEPSTDRNSVLNKSESIVAADCEGKNHVKELTKKNHELNKQEVLESSKVKKKSKKKGNKNAVTNVANETARVLFKNDTITPEAETTKRVQDESRGQSISLGKANEKSGKTSQEAKASKSEKGGKSSEETKTSKKKAPKSITIKDSEKAKVLEIIKGIQDREGCPLLVFDEVGTFE